MSINVPIFFASSFFSVLPSPPAYFSTSGCMPYLLVQSLLLAQPSLYALLQQHASVKQEA